MMPIPRGAVACLLFAAALGQTTFAWSQAPYPAKPLRIVVPFAPGGSTDLMGRTIARKLNASLGQSVLVDNRPGAGGNIGTELAARAPADGYTLLVVPSSFAINPSLYQKVPYDPVKDFDPVAGIASYTLVLVAHPSVPVDSVKAVIALARSRPGVLKYASAGSGTTTHLAGELFRFMTKADITHIPYRGSGPSLADLIGGQIELSFGSTSAVPHVKGGRLRALGVTGAVRAKALPDVPTIAEAGVPGYEVTSWNAAFAPKGTPAAIVARLNGEIGKALAAQDALDVLQAQGLEPMSGTSEGLAQLVAAELARWEKVIKASGARAD
jgi:tripartite-type tricarboxylate transporter receptor subunit TctC